MKNKISLFNQKLVENAKVCDTQDMPVGLVISTGGKVVLKYSLSKTIKQFEDVESLMDFVLAN